MVLRRALLVLALAACARPPAVAPLACGGPVEPIDVLRTTSAPADRIALQLDEDGGVLVWTEPGVAAGFARVPAFTLYRDGLLIRQTEARAVVEQRLAPAERDALLARVEALGGSRLVSHPGHCACFSDGTRSCLEDGSTTILRVRKDAGSELRELFTYGGMWNDPAAANAIVALLEHYPRDGAQPYRATRGTLVSFRLPRDEGPCQEPDAPMKRLLDVPDPALVVWATAVSPEDFARIDPRGALYCASDRVVRAKLIPWLPDADHAAAIEAWQRRALAER